MIDAADVLDKFLKAVMKDVINDMENQGMKSSGETERLFEVLIEENNRKLEGSILGPSYLQSLITGRGPTRSGGGGDGQTLQEKLFDWIVRESILPREANMSQESLSWAMAVHMHEHGNKLFQSGSDTGILRNHITESRLKIFSDEMTSLFSEAALIETDKIFL